MHSFGHRFLVLAALAALHPAVAQSVAPASASTATPSPAAADQPVQLSVFEVSSGTDKGYASSTAMSGTRTNEKLENLPNSISVMTADFLADLGALNFFDAADFGVGTENVYNDSGSRGAAIGTRSGNQLTIRGLPSVRQLRDGFPWYMPQDIFNTERIEFSRGPGGLSYGDVDAGGTVNVTTKRATFNRARRTVFATRFDDFGSRRASFDHQQSLIPGRVGMRINGVYHEGESWRQRAGSGLIGGAAALRWQIAPRTSLDVTFERADQRDGQTHVVLTDQTAAYVLGTGTNALDAIPDLAGVQTNGVGQFQILPAGAKQIWTLLDGRFYNLESTPTAVFRSSRAQEGAAVGNAVQNPALLPRRGVAESIVPRGQDWGGPDNYVDQRWHAATVELRHEFTPKLSTLFALNTQRDVVVRPKSMNDSLQDTFGGRSVFIDVNPMLPDPTDPTGARLIPNPRYQQRYVQHQLIATNDRHEIHNARAVIVYDAVLPFEIRQRFVISTGVRVEEYGKDVFDENFTAAEIARRGLTGTAAFASNNQVYRYHYLVDGNSDAALRNPPIPGVTEFTRQNVLTNSARFEQNLWNTSVNVLGSYFKGRLRTSIGLGRDRWHQKTANLGVNPAAGNVVAFLDANNQPIPEGAKIPVFDFTEQWVTNQTYGGVFHALPWLSLTGAWLESTQFTDNVGRDLNNKALPGLRGKGVDGGVRLNFLDGRITLSYVRFQTVGTNVSTAISTAARDELNPLLATPITNLTDFRDRRTVGDEVEMFFSPTPRITGRIAYSTARVTFINFFPLLETKLAEARATAQARGLDPAASTPVTDLFFENQRGVAANPRSSASFTGRYTFTEGSLRGLALGVAARYAKGRPRGAINIAGTVVLPAATTQDEYIFNPFVSYRRKFGSVQWTGQLNVNNVFDRVTDQGSSYRFVRWTDPRQFVFTNSFAF